MKILILIAAPFCFMLFNPDIQGVWTSSLPDEEGNEMPVTLTFEADTYQADFANDGLIDVKGTYSIEGGNISMQDAADIENPCPGVGVYAIEIEGDNMRFALVSDECEIRKRSLKVMVMSRKK